MKRGGWFQESYRHSLAARGVSTAYFAKKRRSKYSGSLYGERPEPFGRARELEVLSPEQERYVVRSLRKDLRRRKKMAEMLPDKPIEGKVSDRARLKRQELAGIREEEQEVLRALKTGKGTRETYGQVSPANLALLRQKGLRRSRYARGESPDESFIPGIEGLRAKVQSADVPVPGGSSEEERAKKIAAWRESQGLRRRYTKRREKIVLSSLVSGDVSLSPIPSQKPPSSSERSFIVPRDERVAVAAAVPRKPFRPVRRLTAEEQSRIAELSTIVKSSPKLLKEYGVKRKGVAGAVQSFRRRAARGVREGGDQYLLETAGSFRDRLSVKRSPSERRAAEEFLRDVSGAGVVKPYRVRGPPRLSRPPVLRPRRVKKVPDEVPESAVQRRSRVGYEVDDVVSRFRRRQRRGGL